MKKSKGIRILSIVCIILLVGMYVATFVAAITASPYSGGLFLGCLLCTVFVPIFLHIMIRLFALMTEKKEGETTLHEIHQARKKERLEERGQEK